MKRKKLGGKLFLGALLSGVSFAGDVAAQDLTPVNGLWIINQENNGQPGRGFQLDVQNDILVLTFYGYDNSGSSRFWLASGVLQPGSNQVTMDLGAYEGGRAFGDPPKDATYIGPEGTVTIRFDSLTSGEICLPNEPCRSISPFNFGWLTSASELLGSWVAAGRDLESGTTYGSELTFVEVLASTGPAVIDRARGELEIDDDGNAAFGPVVCAKLVNPDPWDYSCSAEVAGELIRFNMVLRRNAIQGETYDQQSGDVNGIFVGFRTVTPSGRTVIPN